MSNNLNHLKINKKGQSFKRGQKHLEQHTIFDTLQALGQITEPVNFQLWSLSIMATSIRTAYSRHVLRAALEGYQPITLRQFVALRASMAFSATIGA